MRNVISIRPSDEIRRALIELKDRDKIPLATAVLRLITKVLESPDDAQIMRHNLVLSELTDLKRLVHSTQRYSEKTSRTAAEIQERLEDLDEKDDLKTRALINIESYLEATSKLRKEVKL